MSTKEKQVRYKWDRWFSRRNFRLRRGRDFDCLTHGMAQQVRNKAAKRGFKVSIQIVEDTLIVTVLGVPRDAQTR